MAKTREVETSVGTFTVRKPVAGVRNDALIKAESHSGNMKMTILMAELTPTCVTKVPVTLENGVPIPDIIRGLETEDFDLLFEAIADLMDLEVADEKKNN